MTSHTDMSGDVAGIWSPHEALYIQSMLFNAESALTSIHRVSDALEAMSEMSPTELQHAVDYHGLLNELQNIVVQGAALSRYFWPAKKDVSVYAARSRHLRTTLGVGEGSPLKSRDLRNAIEHFDERLDEYLAQGIVGHILPEYVGPRPSREGLPLHLFRAYYLDTGIFALLGKEYEMQPLVDEIVRIHHALSYSAEHGSRLQQPPAGAG